MLEASLQGTQHQEIVRLVCELPSLNGNPPDFRINGVKQKAADNWRERCTNASQRCSAFWETPEYEVIKGLSYLRSSEVVHFTLPQEGNWLQHSAILEQMPFELGNLGSPFEQYWTSDNRRWGFGRSMSDHGFAAVFRGVGHDRLVSRRWLDFGPWRVIRRPNDTTFIQFHDLAITDPAAAYAQAAPGHQRMGVDPLGGFIQGIDESVIAEVGGLYFAATRRLEIVVAQRIVVEQQDMRVACGLRLHHRLHPAIADRIDHIAYIFMERADAAAHLHELWLRELECWYVDGRGKHRLDLDYHPVPNPPAWVRALDDK